jgi:hypothetical protein
VLYHLSYTHHRRLDEAAMHIVTCRPWGLAKGYRFGFIRLSATAFAWSLDGPGLGTKAVPR